MYHISAYDAYTTDTYILDFVSAVF